MRMVLVRIALPLLLALATAGCGETPRNDEAGFDLFGFFDGAARSRGVVTTALVSKEPFTATFAGKRTDGGLVLEERFLFPDGERLQRWRLVAIGDGRYTGSVETEGADGDLHPPVPVSGRSGADGVELDYDGFAPGGDRWLHFRHRMRRQPDGTVRNQVRVSKFGVPLAGAQVIFERVPQAADSR